MNCPTSVGSLGSLLNTGASVVKPLGDQKPDVVQSVRGQGPPSSLSKAKMLLQHEAVSSQGRGVLVNDVIALLKLETIWSTSRCKHCKSVCCDCTRLIKQTAAVHVSCHLAPRYSE